MIPTDDHLWQQHPGSARGAGYLRRWIAGETIGERLRRNGAETVPFALRIIRAIGSSLAYLHDSGSVHGAIALDATYFTPTGRVWMLGWQWAVPRDEIPTGVLPDRRWTPQAPEWQGGWAPAQAAAPRAAERIPRPFGPTPRGCISRRRFYRWGDSSVSAKCTPPGRGGTPCRLCRLWRSEYFALHRRLSTSRGHRIAPMP